MPSMRHQGFEQFGQASFAVKVQAVVGRVLCDYDQFAHTACGQLPGLFQQGFHRHRSVGPPNQGNGAITALPVAAFGNFQVSVMFRGGEPAFGRKRWPGSRLQRPNDVVPILHAEELIDLGQLGTQLLRITLAQAAHDEQPFDFTRLFGGGGPEDHGRSTPVWRRR